MSHGKAYLEARKQFDREHEYSPAEAISLVKELSKVKFNESVEVHVRTGLNVRHADDLALEMGRGRVELLDELSGVHAVLTERGSDRRRGRRGPAGGLELELLGDFFLGHGLVARFLLS